MCIRDRDTERRNFRFHDLDQDGWLDLLLEVSCGMAIMMRTGPRSFTERPEVLGGFESSIPYTIATWQTPNRPLVLMSLGAPDCGFYIGFVEGERDGEGYPVFEPTPLYDGHPSTDPDGYTGLSAGSPMGGAVSDLNRDGVLDLFLTLDPTHTPVSYTHLTLPTICSV